MCLLCAGALLAIEIDGLAREIIHQQADLFIQRLGFGAHGWDLLDFLSPQCYHKKR